MKKFSRSLLTAKVSAIKPERCTHLRGTQLVVKDHPTIQWRGKIDLLCALIVEAQIASKRYPKFVRDLQEILEFVRSLLMAEYRQTPLAEIKLLGLNMAEIRERSHYPEKFFAHQHLALDLTIGELGARLNLLRAATRETEIAAVIAFRNAAVPRSMQKKYQREDIITALNRLSSLFYILIFQYLPKHGCAQKSALLVSN